jgi:Tfp pilus assembly PilM family ATPase/Tfp pilus assembly protein PilN
MTILLDRFSKTFVGIEFKPDILIISCLKHEFSGLHFMSSSSFPLRDDDETVADIKSFLAENVIGPSEVFVCIPYDWAFTKFTDVPLPKAKGKDSLSHVMKYEAERHIPYEIDEVFFDYQALDRSDNMCKVMIVSAHKDKVNYVREFLDKIHLSPHVITLSPFAVLNSIECSETATAGWHTLIGFAGKPATFGRKDEICLHLFIDTAVAYFAVLSGGNCLYLNSVVINRNDPEESISDVISSRITSVLPELLITKIHKLLLSGAISSLSGLPDILAEKLGIDVHKINPLSKYVKEGEMSDAIQLAPSIGVCYLGMGMGTIRMNLLPYKVDFMLKKTGVLFSKISIPLIVIMIIGIFAGDMFYNKRQLSKINEKIEENSPEIKEILKITSELDMLKQQREFYLNTKNSNVVLDILSELTGILPTDAWISNLQYKESDDSKDKTSGGELTISGFARSSSILISILDDSPFFEKVEFVGPVKKRRNLEGFKIKAETVNPSSGNIPEAESSRAGGLNK